MRGLVTAVVVALVLATAGPAGALPPPILRDRPPPEVAAAAWLLVDAGSGAELAAFDAGTPRPMASVTKLMTALVVVENTSPDEIVVISESAAATGEAEIGLVPGETWTVRELLAATLVRSGNDAAVALAEHVGGGDAATFVAMMNEKAAQLGLVDTSFANPHGLDDPDHYTSARDLAALAVVVLADPLIARTVRTHVVKFRSDPEGRSRRAINTNRLLGAYPGVVGMKTGYTGDAGRVLVAAADIGGRILISVVMNAEDHFDATRRLFEYGYETAGLRDALLRPLAMQEGGGGPESVELPDWLRVRLEATPTLAPGSDALTDPLTTPGGMALVAALGRMVDMLPGTQSGAAP